MDVKEELIKQRLLNTKRTNEEIKANIEKSLLFEENNDLCKKEEAISILQDCTRCIKTITRLCNTAINETEKSFPNYDVVLVYVDEMEFYFNNELKGLVESYNLLKKKRSLISIFKKNKA